MRQRSGVTEMNDSPVDCQNRDETEPPRDSGAVRRLMKSAVITIFNSIPYAIILPEIKIPSFLRGDYCTIYDIIF